MRKRFNQYSCCKKCGFGYQGIGTKFVRLAFNLGDVIRRECGRCGFVWDEEPVDALLVSPHTEEPDE